LKFSLLSYNIRYGGVGREDHLAAAIRESNADLVILQEATRPRIVERLANSTGMTSWAAREGQSVAFLSRIEVSQHYWHQIPSTRRAFLEVVLAGTETRVFGLHLRALHANWTERRRVRDLRALLERIKRYQHGFHILTGDFNTLAPGAFLEATQLPLRLRPLLWLSGGKVRWETVQIMLEADYVDGFRALHPLDPGFTFPSWNPHIRLDYVFLPSPFAECLKSCEVLDDGDLTRRASDHFPLMAVFEEQVP
jgi:endonuclease/exonuclease/phosphatase family metal-dependent hydrolase